MNEQVLIAAGGTGGHVFPALALAKNLRERGYIVSWMGTKAGMEAEIVPAAGFEIDFLRIGGIRGKRIWTKIIAPWRLLKAIWQARQIIRSRKPHIVVGFGGFVSGPAGLAALWQRIPLLIHEQNALPGLTNKWLSRWAQNTYTGFPNVFSERVRAKYIGNPVRPEIEQIPGPKVRYRNRGQGPLHLLILGGSLGALAINRLMPAALALLPEQPQIEVWHQCGRAHGSLTEKAYAQAGVQARIDLFIDDMAQAYAWADLVVCRAGALTISELSVVGVAALLIPFPYAVDDHQYYNAMFLVEHEAAVCCVEKDLDADGLAQTMLGLLDRDLLLAMALHSYAVGRRDAARSLGEACASYLSNQREVAA